MRAALLFNIIHIDLGEEKKKKRLCLCLYVLGEKRKYTSNKYVPIHSAAPKYLMLWDEVIINF